MKKILVSSAILLSAILTSTTVTAGDKTPAAEINAAGFINKQPVYQLRLKNNTAASYFIVVKDEFGVVLHEESVSGVNITRHYQLNTLELGNTQVVFEVFTSNGVLAGTFKVSGK
jgi:hypothetical protein